jgi:hypothetical protein
MIKKGAEDTCHVGVLSNAVTYVTGEIDGRYRQCARCEHLPTACWLNASQRREFAVGLKGSVTQSREVMARRFDPPLDLAELPFAVVNHLGKLSKTETSGKALSPEFLAKNRRFMIHWPSVVAAGECPSSTSTRICYALRLSKRSQVVSRFLSNGAAVT